jgi:bifunctional DNA-binding transcriptional regulator/antitoxin component of YhaV-PrlF toxin-antitoxin module
LYPVVMTATGDLRVSARGQMSLPSSARHRWGLDEGGDVGYLDLGDAMVIVPGGTTKLRRELLDAVTSHDWDLARQGFGDDELANE